MDNQVVYHLMTTFLHLGLTNRNDYLVQREIESEIANIYSINRALLPQSSSGTCPLKETDTWLTPAVYNPACCHIQNPHEVPGQRARKHSLIDESSK